MGSLSLSVFSLQHILKKNSVKKKKKKKTQRVNQKCEPRIVFVNFVSYCKSYLYHYKKKLK